ncbi:acetolactate decarboxylase [Methanocalculus alkaliphilus]|uniref:acetolactate decarboxylase n=1 Tax=Methanocalculus alkaliphilus TaxID=768730 RepID=UPI0020A1ABDF|nr:acetolactate decarboxylase [Methanocalculus alkaliphilus]MCP1716001.1 acetolactate decarboxylase [Methanocalculus alkaliphilus]
MRNSLLVATLIIGILLGAGSASLLSSPSVPEDREVLYQVSTIEALLESVYDGVIPVGDLVWYGDTGIGTFDSLDGELILVDGIVYQARGDGSVRVAPSDLLTPLAMVSFFDPDIILTGASTSGYAAFEDLVDAEVRSGNLIYMIRIDGYFSSLTVRAPHRQERPYPRLVDALADQYIATHTNVSGTAVGTLLPEYMGGLNVPGYHLHFISDDRTIGGHIVDFSLEDATILLDETPRFMMLLPSEGGFIEAELGRDLSHELAAVERPVAG